MSAWLMFILQRHLQQLLAERVAREWCQPRRRGDGFLAAERASFAAKSRVGGVGVAAQLHLTESRVGNRPGTHAGRRRVSVCSRAEGGGGGDLAAFESERRYWVKKNASDRGRLEALRRLNAPRRNCKGPGNGKLNPDAVIVPNLPRTLLRPHTSGVGAASPATRSALPTGAVHTPRGCQTVGSSVELMLPPS